MAMLLLSCFSRVRLCATPETATHQAPPSLGFSRQEYWSGLPFPSPIEMAISYNNYIRASSLYLNFESTHKELLRRYHNRLH